MQREFDRIFNQFWNELPAKAQALGPGSFQVKRNDDGWRIDVPLPGIDPSNVNLEVSGNTLMLRVQQGEGDETQRYEHTLSMPQFLDTEKLTASCRHGLLQVVVPFKESVKPRRVPIELGAEEKKQLKAGA